MEERQCRFCFEFKTLDQYYKNPGQSKFKCKDCTKEHSRIKHLKEMEEKGGGDRVRIKPNKYYDIYQRTQTFQVMELLGFTFNEETGIWTKPGFKEIIDGKIIFPFLKPIPKKKVRGVDYEPRRRVKTSDIKKIRELHKKGMTVSQIESLLGFSNTTIYKWINEKSN